MISLEFVSFVLLALFLIIVWLYLKGILLKVFLGLLLLAVVVFFFFVLRSAMNVDKEKAKAARRLEEERRLKEERRMKEEQRLKEERRIKEEQRLKKELQLKEEQRLKAEKQLIEEERVKEAKKLREEQKRQYDIDLQRAFNCFEDVYLRDVVLLDTCVFLENEDIKHKKNRKWSDFFQMLYLSLQYLRIHRNRTVKLVLLGASYEEIIKIKSGRRSSREDDGKVLEFSARRALRCIEFLQKKGCLDIPNINLEPPSRVSYADPLIIEHVKHKIMTERESVALFSEDRDLKIRATAILQKMGLISCFSMEEFVSDFGEKFDRYYFWKKLPQEIVAESDFSRFSKE